MSSPDWTYQIIRSRRKTAAIVINARGEVTVRAPLHASRAAIDGFVRAKSEWIERKLTEVRDRQAQHPAHRFTAGELFPYQGRSYPLDIVKSRQPGLELANEAFRLSAGGPEQAAGLFAKWYRARARELLCPRVEFYARQNGFTYQTLRLTSARARWGSCSSRGTLSFSWRTAALPPELLDYVVVHELCHLRQPNHSPAFWAEVERILPDWLARRKALAGWGARVNWD